MTKSTTKDSGAADGAVGNSDAAAGATNGVAGATTGAAAVVANPPAGEGRSMTTMTSGRDTGSEKAAVDESTRRSDRIRESR